jgi:hypothetical protein
VTICVGLGRVRRQRLCAFELLRGGIRSPLRGSSPTCSASPVSVGRVGLQVQPIIEPVLCGTPGSLTLGLRFDSSWDENDSRSGRDPLSTSIPGATCGGAPFFLWSLPTRHRLKAAGLALPRGPVAGLAQDEEPGSAGGEAGGGRRLGA